MSYKADDALVDMARTFRERNKVYGNNYRRVGPVMDALFEGQPLTLETAADHELFHLFSLLVVKLTRFAASACEHRDSIHDMAVYAAMIESILAERALEEESALTTEQHP